VLLHGFSDTWRTWELVLPALERRHDVLALTLPGHAGGPPIEGEVSHEAIVTLVERALDEAGFESAHLAGNSLGGYLSFVLAARGRARSVVALAPAGGWAAGDGSFRDVLALQADQPAAAAVLSAPRDTSHIPPGLLEHQNLAGARFPARRALVEHGLREGWPLDPSRVDCPLRIVWGTGDRLLPWPSTAARYRAWFPHADWVELDGVGHAPHLEVPLETAELILGWTS
jgi:pimeloyl-ACP methyl ester carboxylesterase